MISKKRCETLSKRLFVRKRVNGQYLFAKSEMTNNLYEGENIWIPIVIDTEYWQTTFLESQLYKDIVNIHLRGTERALPIPNHYSKGRRGITTQIKGIHEKEGVIFDHPDLVELAQHLGEKTRHHKTKSGFHPVDYLRQEGIDAKLYRDDKIIRKFHGENIPTATFILYAHFPVAEWGMIAEGDFKKDMDRVALSKKGSQLEMQRRLRTFTEGKFGQPDDVEMPWRMRINGLMYRIKIVLIDTCAMHGNVSYQEFCDTTGVSLPNKKLMDSYKTKMHLAYFEDPENFDKYALGDLEVYKALSNNAELFKEIWRSLGIEAYYKPPKLTIGSTVKTLFEAKTYKDFKICPDDEKAQKELLEKVCQYGTAEYLKKFVNSTLCLNAKVGGGRCFNNQTTLTLIRYAVLCDIDISGCYGEGQRNQLYPFGRPVTEEFDYPSKLNKYFSLREWLKERNWGKKSCELVPGLWQAIVCTKVVGYDTKGNPIYALLETPQDFVPSWFDFKLSEISTMPTDTDLQNSPQEDCIEVKTGITKILGRQIINGIITHEFIDWLFNVCNPSQRNELLDGLFIQTSMYYPAYDRVNSPEELLERISQHNGSNTTKTGKRTGGSRKTKITEECTAWYPVNLGKFIIDDLLAYRKIYPKDNDDGSKNSLNTLYKLCINTLYGDMVSPYFKISNVVVGNNITARARAACYYTEKGLNGTMSITDGTSFDLNKVLYPLPNRKVTSQTLVSLYRETNVGKRNVKLAPIDNCDEIKMTWKEVTVKGKDVYFPCLHLHKNGEVTTIEPYIKNDKWQNAAHDWINQKAMEHLQNLFNVDVLKDNKATKLKITNNNGIPVIEYENRIGQFEYEAKSFYTSGHFHGASNYYLQGKGSNNLAMRSYEKKKEHLAVWYENGEVRLTKYVDNNPGECFMGRLSNPYKVERSKVFIKPAILKHKEYRKNHSKWHSLGREFGDSYEKAGLLREFSLSQFTFQSVEQFKNIEREMNANKRKYGQSYEGYFINDDGTLNFQEMITEVDKAIGENAHSLNKVFDKSRNRHRTQDMYHPEQENLDKIRLALFKPITQDDAIDFLDDNSHILIDEDGYVYTPDDDYGYCTSAGYVDDPSILDDFEFTLS